MLLKMNRLNSGRAIDWNGKKSFYLSSAGVITTENVMEMQTRNFSLLSVLKRVGHDKMIARLIYENRCEFIFYYSPAAGTGYITDCSVNPALIEQYGKPGTKKPSVINLLKLYNAN